MTRPERALLSRRLSRRQLLRAGLLAAGSLALGAACAPSSSAPSAPATAKPAESKPAESKPATSAPAAAKPATTAAETKPAAPTAETKPAAGAAKPAETKPAAGAATKGGTLRVALYVDPATMDPHLSGSKIDRQVFHNVYEPLVTLGAKLDIKPGLAESWAQPDPKTLVFKLRQGVKFHDGTDFNAEAVKFNFDRMQNPDTKSVRRGEIANVDTVEVVDPSTIRLNLKRPDAALLATLTDRAGMMISPTAVQKLGADLQRTPVGTGPFQFVEWIKDDHLTLKRFEGYWGKDAGPYLDQVRYRTILDDTVKVQSLIGGEIDVADYLPPREVANLKGNNAVVVMDVPSLASFAYQLNTTKPPFDKKPLRQAVAYAVDTAAIVKGVWLGIGVPSNGPIAPSSWAYDASVKPIARDVAKAKQLLADGGMPNGFSFTVTQNNPPINVQEVEAIKAQLAEAGITMDINVVDDATLLSNGNNHNFDMIGYQWSGRPDPDGNTYQFFHTQQGSGLNWAGYSNPKVDDLLDKEREVSDQGERKKLFSDLVKTLQDDQPWLFIIHPIEPKGFSPKVQNYDPVPDGMMRFRDVWLK
ncbi:MAG: peptide ABC transporter substrate-binding protein [Chloroflexi bacterium]|nr:peptide ABC transporter substrate-binding protein [Chloroflexota bacterium]